MKILFFIGEMAEGGAERVVSILANELVNDFDVEILTYYKNTFFYEIDSRIKLACIEEESNTINKLKNINYVREHFKNTDVVISFLAPFNMYGLLINSSVKKPIIVADRNDPRRIPSNSMLRVIRNILYKKADHIVVQTKYNQDYFSDVVKRKSSVISNPIDLEEYKGAALVTKKNKKIVTVGRLTPQKNQKLLIEVFSEICQIYDDYNLYIYGDGPIKNELQQYINNMNLKDKVYLMGQKKDIYQEIKDAEIFVLSSDYEGMPNALIEAMCLGLPVISTKVSGATELINDGVNGYLVSNKEELKDRIIALIKDNDLKNELSKNAIKLNDELNKDVIIQKWKEIINKIK